MTLLARLLTPLQRLGQHIKDACEDAIDWDLMETFADDPPWPHLQWWEDASQVTFLTAWMRTQPARYSDYQISHAGTFPEVWTATYRLARAEAAELQQKEQG